MRKLVSESLSGTSTDRAALRVERNASLPQEQRVEQLARAGAPAAAARRLRLPAEVALADDLALRGGGEHLDRPLAQHRVEDVPRCVVHELEQALVHRGERDLAVRGRFAVGRP